MKLLKVLAPYQRPLFFIGLFVLFFVYAYTMIDFDFGWHLRSGEYFMANGIPATDIFTYTAQQFPWVNHEWLSDIFVAWVYNIGGYGLLAVIYAGLWTISVISVSKKVPLYITLVAAIGLLPFLGVRALTWSVFFLAVLITILAAKNKKWHYTIPLLMLLWSSMHGSFLIGFAYGAWVLINHWSWKLFTLGLIAFALTFCTPYGYHLYGEVLRTVLDANLSGVVTEWARLAFPITSVIYVLLWCAILVVVNGRRWKQYIRFDTFLLIWSALSVRMLPIFIIVSLSQMPQLLRKLEENIPMEARGRLRKAARTGGISLVAIAIGLQIFIWTTKIDGEGVTYPSQAVAYLQKNPCRGSLFNSYDFGGYLIWKLPSQKVYIDGRMPSWRHEGEKYIDTYLEVLQNPNVRKDEFNKYSINCVLIENNSSILDDLREENWQLEVNDGYSSLLIKS